MATSSSSASSATPAAAASSPQQALKLGRLVNMEWKVGVSLANSQCKRLNSPFVRLCFHIADENDLLSSHSFQLNIPEFEEFLRNFDSIAEAF